MKKICPHCGKKSKITCHAYRPTKYSIYNRISKYKCKNCGGHLIRSKNEPSIKDNIVISIITFALGAVFYFLLCEFQSYDIYDIFLTIVIMVLIWEEAYFILGLIDAYFPKKLLPADERDVLYIPMPDAIVTFAPQIPKKLNRYDMLTTQNEAISLFCVKLDRENNTAHCRFLTEENEYCSEPIDLYINGKFKTNCAIAPIHSLRKEQES
ncbi:MAG: hypothetical protein K2N60_04090 [Oscillospiraceae bacterium]|nr:hypothetical protein [Oscillospiraceae bacterium]